jgi:hypothetical protein
MSRVRTLTNLIADTRQRAGMESSQFVTDAEVTEYLNQSIAELYDLVLAARGEEYYSASGSFSTSPGIQTYSLPASFMQLLGVDVTLGGVTFTITPYNFAARNAFNQWRAWTAMAWGPGQAVYYRLQASNISFIPTPTGVYTVNLWYVPCATRLSGPGDTFDGFNGWEEYVVVDAAMKCLEKEESDVSQLAARKMSLTARIQGMAGNRDAGNPETVSDVMGRTGNGGWYF